MQTAADAAASTSTRITDDPHWRRATDTIHDLSDGPEPEVALSVAVVALARLTMDRYRWLAWALAIDGDHISEGQLEDASQ